MSLHEPYRYYYGLLSFCFPINWAANIILNNIYQILNRLMSISDSNTTPEISSTLEGNHLFIDDEASQVFLTTATYINRLHYEELLLKLRIREINKIFNL